MGIPQVFELNLYLRRKFECGCCSILLNIEFRILLIVDKVAVIVGIEIGVFVVVEKVVIFFIFCFIF